MNSKKLGITFTFSALTLALVIAGFSLSSLSDAYAQNKKVKGLIGSWDVQIETPVQGTFPAFLSFFSDGIMIGDEANSDETSVYGNWSSTGGRGVAYTFKSLLGTPQSVAAGSLKVVGTLEYDAGLDTWTGPFKIEVYDTSGNVIFSDRGTLTGTRIPIETLD
jgi:hypothetical protein